MLFNVAIKAYGASTELVADWWIPPPPVVGVPSNVSAAVPSPGLLDVAWDYATVTGDSLVEFLIYIGTSSTPDWGAAEAIAAPVIEASYVETMATALTGTVYVAVRAVGDGVTSDSAVVSVEVPFYELVSPEDVAAVLDGSADVEWSYPAGSAVVEGFKIYVGEDPEPNWYIATDVGFAGGDADSETFAYSVPTPLKGPVYVMVRAYGAGLTADSELKISTMTVALASKLAWAATEGLDLVHIAVIYFGGVVGTKYYSTRPIPGITGVNWQVKLMGVPEVPKRSDPSAVRFDALNDDLTLRLLNSPEGEDGTYDTNRLQDLLAEVPLNGAMVDVGVADLRGLTTLNYVKWDGRYRVDRVDRNNREAMLYCVDRMLHPGEKMIGSTVNDADWPLAPNESLGAVRGPVFGKVDGLPLVPVDVGLFATLSNEIDDQDGVIEISGAELNLWPNSGYVEIGDEVVYYPVIDRVNKRLGSASSKCTRGTGFPATTPATHNDFSPIREVYTGRESSLNGTHLATATGLTIRTAFLPENGGVILIGNEAIRYTTRTGFVLSGLTRGVPVPTLAKVHDIGSPVRTIPVGPNGLPRYRYLVAEGEVNAASNIRVQDENGNDLPYMGGAATLSQVTPESGKTWSVLDLPARPRFEKFEQSGSDVPQEWICATDGRVDAEGVALPLSFIHWIQGDQMSQEHATTWPRAIDPSASTRAVILEATTGKNIFQVMWDGKWDLGLNSPRYRYGRFRNARLRMLVQYDRQTSIQANYQVHSNATLVKAGVFPVPTVGGGGGGGQVTGSQQLPQSRWGTQIQSREVRLGSRTTNAFANGLTGYWIDPVRVAESGGTISGGRPDHSAAFSGDTRTYLSGAWNFTGGVPALRGTGSIPVSGALSLYSTGDFPPPSSGDKLTALVVTLHNPVGSSAHWTGWDGAVTIYSDTEFAAGARTYAMAIGNTQAKVVKRIDLTGLTWANLQSLKVTVDQFNGIGTVIKGSTVGNISVSVEFVPDVEGQRVGTIVDGSYFRTSGTTSPSVVYEQRVSLGQVAKDWARANNRDPWDFFALSVSASQAMKVTITLPTAGDGLQFAVADVFLELEYDALSVIYDGLVLADVDGRTGVPMNSETETPAVLENPADLLAYLVDGAEFYNMASDRDEDSFLVAHELAGNMGWKMARAITEPIPLRDLVASLCAESRLLLLADGLELFARFRFEEATRAASVRTVGQGFEVRHSLVKDEIQIVNRLEDIHNSLGCYYRRNYVTGDYRTVIEEQDPESIRLYQEKRATPNLDWHQSSRGYTGGFDGQKVAVMRLTKYLIDKAARMWDYATFEVAPSAAEDLHRYDVVTLNWPRSGYYSTPGRVMALQRLENPIRFSVTAEMGRATLGYVWQSAVDPATYIKLAEAAIRMDFVIAGQLVAQLTSAGHLRCRGGFSVSSASTVDTVKADTGTAIVLYRTREDGSFAGKHERYLSLDASGNVTLHARNNGTTVTARGVKAPGPITDFGGAGGILSPGILIGDSIEFYLANRLVMYIDEVELRTLGSIRANLGMRMGSV